ncbi:MAG: RNA polymerase sigma factor [Planctomycetes bacterium]|nr:RNA polymerase sigma factor [Planctomycetota bacterium]
MKTSGTVPVQTLLEHHDFVRRLARSLVRDEAAADDLAQETWLAVLESPPREARSLRGWFASVMRSRAANERRTLARRVVREAAVARNESDESEARVLERVETSQSLVAAVLALDEPYRSVVLLHHYDGLGAAEIARSRGVPEGTVRSHLSRGHALLRERLDRGYGERKTWLAALAPLASGVPTKTAFVGALSAKMVAWTAAALVLAALAPFAWRAMQGSGASSVGVAEPTQQDRDREFLASLAEPVTVRRPALTIEDARNANPVTTVSQVRTPPRVDVSVFSVDELLVLAEHAQNLACQRTLARDDDWPEALQSLAARNDTGIFWLLPLDRVPFEEFNPLGVRGGGAYYSFALRTHDYNQLPDLGLDQKTFSSNFTGSDVGFFLPLEFTTLLDVPTTIDGVPGFWDERSKERWAAMWATLPVEASSSHPEFRAELKRLGLTYSAPARAGGVYLLRSAHTADAADTLVAFQVTEVRDGATRIAWRRLAAPAIPEGPRNVETAPRLATGPAPTWMIEMDTASLLDTLAEIRRVAQQKLFVIEPEFTAQFAAFVAQPNSGLVRVLERNKFTRVVEKRGAGSFWSFATRDHDYGKEPDLLLEQDCLRSGFYGGAAGLLIDCGEVAIESIVKGGRVSPAGWTVERQDAWNFLWDVRPVPVEGRPGAKSLDEAARARRTELGLYGPKAHVGHTYLVRSNLSEEHDLIAAFEVVEHSETGITIVWRKLADFSNEK